MPLDLHIIRAQEFVRLGAQGHLNFEQSKEALAILARACRKRGVCRALLDLRALPVPPKPLFTPTQLAALVGTFREAGFTRQQKLAVLYRSDPHRGARLFAFISIMRGWQVRAFAEFEEALFWLSEEKAQPRQQGAQAIPIRRIKKELDVKSWIAKPPARRLPKPRTPRKNETRPFRRRR
jgi:hypothetical protein